MRESGIRALLQETHALLGQAITGNALTRHRGERMRQPSWWERNRGQRPRAPSQGTHPPVVASTSAQEERIRPPSQAAPSGATMAGRLARPSGVVPPNQRMQPDAAARRRDRANFERWNQQERSTDRSGGAADAPGVRRILAVVEKESKY
jgi:hypothetical protein